jgi:hypothetical protein
MPITINGSGTVTGISAGGLPDDCITTADIAAGAVTDAKVNASAAIADSKLSGTTCKAWVNFNGTSTVAIRASYNVSSITDNGTGNYTVNFTTAMPDANYSVATTTTDDNAAQSWSYVQGVFGGSNTQTAGAVRIYSVYSSGPTDRSMISVAIFR